MLVGRVEDFPFMIFKISEAKFIHITHGTIQNIPSLKIADFWLSVFWLSVFDIAFSLFFLTLFSSL